ncbi:MAG: hypothetical protein DRJ51_08060 [Thermoprotei archaeon]|nr:MAG: hypothetical protein DRJ51_08060 [Thermoprotei archaeon]
MGSLIIIWRKRTIRPCVRLREGLLELIEEPLGFYVKRIPTPFEVKKAFYRQIKNSLLTEEDVRRLNLTSIGRISKLLYFDICVKPSSEMLRRFKKTLKKAREEGLPRLYVREKPSSEVFRDLSKVWVEGIAVERCLLRDLCKTVEGTLFQTSSECVVSRSFKNDFGVRAGSFLEFEEDGRLKVSGIIEPREGLPISFSLAVDVKLARKIPGYTHLLIKNVQRPLVVMEKLRSLHFHEIEYSIVNIGAAGWNSTHQFQ